MKTLLYRCFQERRGASIAMLLILGATLLSFWPGILMSDTSARWAGILTLLHVLPGGELDQWLTPIMTIFMLPFALSEKSVPFFAVLQVSYMALAGLLWISVTSSKRPFWVPLLFALPVVASYVPFEVPDVWTFMSMVVVVAILMSGKQRLGIPLLLLFFISNVILFGFRLNALLLFPVLAFIILKRVSEARWERYVLLALMALSVITIFTAPRLVGYGPKTSTAAAPAWELIGMLRIAKESNLQVDPEIKLDGIANTDNAIKAHSFGTIDSLLWGDNAAFPSGLVLEHPEEIKKKWLKAIRKYPKLYVLMKMRTYECMIGLCDTYLQVNVMPEDPIPLLQGYVSGYVNHAGLGSTILNTNVAITQKLRLIYLPIFWAPFGFLVFFLERRRYGKFDKVLIVVATAYALSFCILNQAASFRYMLPTYAVYTAYQIRFISRLFCSLIQRYGATRAATASLRELMNKKGVRLAFGVVVLMGFADLAYQVFSQGGSLATARAAALAERGGGYGVYPDRITEQALGPDYHTFDGNFAYRVLVTPLPPNVAGTTMLRFLPGRARTIEIRLNDLRCQNLVHVAAYEIHDKKAIANVALGTEVPKVFLPINNGRVPAMLVELRMDEKAQNNYWCGVVFEWKR